LLLVLISRFLTLSAMALYAASLGTTALAAYQVHIFVDFVVSKLPNGVD
jgi:TRAP-type C4-dicarboxylate transport system permease small subunit